MLIPYAIRCLNDAGQVVSCGPTSTVDQVLVVDLAQRIVEALVAASVVAALAMLALGVHAGVLLVRGR